MNLTHGWALGIGAAAVALPIFVHWLTKPKPVQFETSTLRFLRAAVRERRARSRLRDWLVLALRTAAAALAAAAFARPFFADDAVTQPNPTDADAVRVVLLDASQSLAAGDRNLQAFERARATAAERLTYRSGLTANLVVAAAAANATFAQPTSNFAALRDDLAAAVVLRERLNVNNAIATAAKMFVGPPGGSRELVVVSDFQRTSWSQADFSAVPADVVIRFESVAPAEPPPNAAIIGATCRMSAGGTREAVVEIEAANYSPTARKLNVELRLGNVVRRLQCVCAANGRMSLSSDVTLDDVGWQWGEVRLTSNDDALAADDVRPIVCHLRPPPTTALVTRRQRPARASSTYFYTTALSSSTNDSSQSGDVDPAARRLVRIDPIQPGAAELLSAVDVAVVDRPGPLGDDWLQQLLQFVRRGRVLIYSACEPADADNLRRLALAAGSEWRFPVDYAPATDGRRRGDLFLADVKLDRPPFAVFGEDTAEVVRSLRFQGTLATTPRSDALADDLAAVYDDRSACLATGSIGAGRIAVLNADLDLSTLPRTAAFVPLLSELMRLLLQRSAAAEIVDCGGPLSSYLPAGIAQANELRSVDPDGNETGRLREETLGVFWQIPTVKRPGVYRVERFGTTTVQATAAAVPADESDLRALPPEVLTDRLAVGRTAYYRGNTDRRDAPADDLWVWFAAACVGCMLMELVALKGLRA